MHIITHFRNGLITYFWLSTQILHLNLAWQPLVLIWPFGCSGEFKTIAYAKIVSNDRIVACVSTTQNHALVYNNHLLFQYDIFNSFLPQHSLRFCSTCNFNVQIQPSFYFLFHNWIFPFEVTYFEQIFMLTCVLNHDVMQIMGFWFLHFLTRFHFRLSYTSRGFEANTII
jgi:hypothetical protein